MRLAFIEFCLFASFIRECSCRVINGVKPGPRPYLSPREEGTLPHFLKHCVKLDNGETRKDVLAIAELTAIKGF